MTANTKLQFSKYVQIFVAAGEIHSHWDDLLYEDEHKQDDLKYEHNLKYDDIWLRGKNQTKIKQT